MENEREGRPRKKKKRRNRFWYYLYAVVVLILTIAIIVVSMLLLFHVQKIEVSGTKHSEKKDILCWIKEDKYTSNALYAFFKFQFGSYTIPPYLNEIDVKLSAPWALKVTVDEKEIIGCIVVENDYVYFEEEGFVLLQGHEIVEGIPIIEGLEVHEAKKYQKLSIADEKILPYIIELTKVVESNQLTPERIVWEENSMNLYFGGVCVRLGRSDFNEKVLQITPILQELDGKTGVVDLEHYNGTGSKISFKEEVTENE